MRQRPGRNSHEPGDKRCFPAASSRRGSSTLRAIPRGVCWAQSLAVPLSPVRCQDDVTDGLRETVLAAKTKAGSAGCSWADNQDGNLLSKEKFCPYIEGSSSYLGFQ